MTDSNNTLISVVVPVLNEEGNLQRVYDTIVEVFDSLDGYDFELVITDNRSSDSSFEIAQALSESDDRVRAFRFSTNFGYQRSIYAAYLFCSGDAAVQLDADLQDPPEMIPEMIDHWRSGADVVYGVRVSREGESAALTGARKAFYRIADSLSDVDLPRDAGDFRLVDRTVIEVLRQSYDATPYLRGTIAAAGFKQVGIEYDRRGREAGETKFSFGSLIGLAADGVMNHSTKPLQLATMTALAVSVVAVLAMGVYTVGRFVFAQDWPAGFTTLAVVQLFGIALNALFLGIIGSYVGRLYKQAKSPPIVIVDASTDPRYARTVLTPRQAITEADLADPNEGVEHRGG